VQNEYMERVRSRAAEFRAAIEKCNQKMLPITFESFPRGSCGDAALLLAKYLQNAGLGSFDYICGEYRYGEWEFQSHAWLQKGRLIVDITADQFEEITQKVIVTTDHSWHKRFKGKLTHHADFELYDERTAKTLAYAFQRIVSCIDEEIEK